MLRYSRKICFWLALIPIIIILAIIFAVVALRTIGASSFYDLYKDHSYSTAILSIDPLVIYIHEFITPSEADYLINRGCCDVFRESSTVIHFTSRNPLFRSSLYFDPPTKELVFGSHRNSSSAYLPKSDPICDRISQRALSFLGFLPKTTLESLQIVRYYPG